LDELLLKSVGTGDKSAMRVLYQRYNARIYRFVLRLVRDASVAEEIVSEVFLAVWRDARRFEGKSSVVTWLMAIARHKAVSALRRRSEQPLDPYLADTMTDPRDNPEFHTEQMDRCQIIQRCLRELSPRHREIIDLVYYHEKSVKEVAQIVGAPEGTVKTRMFHARRHMSRLLDAAGIHGLS
jgi:RNA polymerase sigma-70 factor (ECF subfamily)